jgi:hypothetical protein
VRGGLGGTKVPAFIHPRVPPGYRTPPEKAKPARDLSRRAYVVRNLTTAGTSAVGSSVASDSIHIGENDEYSMTAVASGGRWMGG